MLKISRPDVVSDQVVDYGAKRFIKLPIVEYLKLLGAWEDINPPQIALINAVNNPRYRFVCAALSRRLGKTYISNVVGQLVTLVPNSAVLIVSPNFSLSSISFELQRRFIKHFELELTRDNLKDKIIELENGSTIRMGSVTTIDSCVGRSYDLIIFDEAALSVDGEAAFNVALRPTLDKPNSKAIFISTPRGRNNWFSKFFARGYSPEFSEWCSIQADYHENPRMTEADVAEARKSMSVAEFQQEYCASFTEFVGQIYQFNQDLCVQEFDYAVVAERFSGCDPGFRDPTAFVVLAYLEAEDIYWVIDEYQDAGKHTAHHAAKITELLLKHGCETVFIDSAAAQFAQDLAYLYDIPTTKAKKDVLPGIAYLQTIVEQNRLRVAPHCTQTLAALDQYRWDPKEGLQQQKPYHDQYSHMADALRYAIYTFVV